MESDPNVETVGCPDFKRLYNASLVCGANFTPFLLLRFYILFVGKEKNVLSVSTYRGGLIVSAIYVSGCLCGVSYDCQMIDGHKATAQIMFCCSVFPFLSAKQP